MHRPILFVTNEPAAGLEDEFNAWYDAEHFPQRRVMPGFLTASRWVCVDGWPRWMAFYELADLGALETPDYFAVSEMNISPWTRRQATRALGRLRVVGEEIDESPAEPMDPNRVSRLVIVKFENVPADAIFPSQRAPTEDGILSIRHFREGTNVWSIIACGWPMGAERIRDRFGRIAGFSARWLNVYSPYFGGPPAN